MVNMAMPDYMLEEICEVTIDRFGCVTDNVFNTIVTRMPYNQLNPQRLRNKLNERTAVHKDNQIGYFTTALSNLVHACGGLDVVKAAGEQALEDTNARMFDNLPRAVCQAAFKHGNRTVDHEAIWTLTTPSALGYRAMYRTKFLDLAAATWKFYTQYEGDAEMQAEGMKALRNYWDGHMRSGRVLNLQLPRLRDMPSRPAGSRPRVED